MSDREDYDSDAPEEFTAEQGIQQEQELSKLQKENKARVAREGKERRRKWAQKKTPRKATVESVQDVSENETHQESSMGPAGMLPPNIVELLAAREKQVFSDSEDEKADSKSTKKKKKRKSSGVDTIILNQTAPPPCLQKSLEFLKKRKMQVPRSQAVLNNSNQALRFLTSSGVLSKKLTN
ncbi:uncharacterized protein LOC133727311 [Rosa rugosa]|uniref:uncharacterized protein LOC133727311 n=1 Tax=Rosa rugosa TaxID=74645 RepID=UPI002B41548C|nr:uncharacterized protein LOC133727311 [Rosa rugosa]